MVLYVIKSGTMISSISNKYENWRKKSRSHLYQIQSIEEFNEEVGNDDEDEEEEEEENDFDKYKWNKCTSLKDLEDVGVLRLKIRCCRGLRSADFGGKSDPFAVVEIEDVTVRTKTVFSTLNPDWEESVKIQIHDINSVLRITVYDEDRHSDPNFLGQVMIPLLTLKAEREERQRWRRRPCECYALKNKKCTERASGEDPRIYIETSLTWNVVRAAVQCVCPNKYVKVPTSFKRTVFITNVRRVRSILNSAKWTKDYLISCFEWEDKRRSATAFVIFLILTYVFEPYMIPLAFLVFIFFRSLILQNTIIFSGGIVEDSEEVNEDDENDDNKTLAERLKAIQEVSLYTANVLGHFASTVEGAKNVLAFRAPFLTWLATAFFLCSTILLFFIPFRVFVFLWGINKFTKKLRNPNHVSTSEILNFLSRAPDDEMLEKSARLSPLSPEQQEQEEEEEEEEAEKEEEEEERSDEENHSEATKVEEPKIHRGYAFSPVSSPLPKITPGTPRTLRSRRIHKLLTKTKLTLEHKLHPS